MGKTDEILNILKQQLENRRQAEIKIFDQISGIKDTISEKHEKVMKEIGCLTTKIEVHKAKTSIWGAIGGAIPSGLVMAWMLIKEHFKGG